jgi:nifR3 family TIM-barrel protein
VGLRIGRIERRTPVVLAPMAGVTNAAYRQLCREQAEADGGDGIFVCEMITSRGVVERDARSLAMLAFDPGERLHSVQLYGVDPWYVGEAVRILAGEYGVGHVDLNFGCPAPKVTRKGGGAALPYKRRLFEAIVQAAVDGSDAYQIPVTVKTRLGLDDDHLTFLEAGRIAETAGVAAIALHGRTAAQHYSGTARWEAIAELKQAVTTIPVLGNGDLWDATNAMRMVEQTGCDGVVVGRGCLGRPWFFRELAAAFAGRPAPPPPNLGAVAAILRRHATLLTDLIGEDRGIRDMRKHMAWYLKGFVVGQPIRAALGLVSSLAELDDLLDQLDHNQPYPDSEIGAPRGRTNPLHRVHVPEGWLDDPDELPARLGAHAELAISGG